MKNIHLIGNAHLDPVWIWRWPEGYQEIKATFRSALDRMKEVPGFIFTCSSAAYYEWVEENAPEMFVEIKERVREGRWRIVGGWWVQSDCNLPAGESFARHALYSQLYYLSRFGAICRVGYNVDSFGHNGMLPQLLRQGGMDSYVMMRPDENEKDLPDWLFWWESPDGSRVLTFRIPLGYGTGGEAEQAHRRIEDTRRLTGKHGHPFMLFYGVGNHGGGPTLAVLREFERHLDANEQDLEFSYPDLFFAEIRKEVESKRLVLPVVREELQHHASGCYASHSEIKRNNRLAEQTLIAAEKFAAIATRIKGLPGQQERLRQAWKRVLFNQFHDILCGTSIATAYDDCRHQHGEAISIGNDILNAALQKISWAINTAKPEADGTERRDIHHSLADLPLVLFNPHAWPVRVPVTVDKCAETIRDDAGQVLELQPVRSNNLTITPIHTLITADLPALGYRVYWVRHGNWTASAGTGQNQPAARQDESAIRIGDDYVLTPWLRVEFDPQRGIIRRLVWMINQGLTLLTDAARPVIIADPGDTWGHGIFKYQQIIGEFHPLRMEWLERGPLRACLRVQYQYSSSTLRQDFRFYRDFNYIDVQAEVDWHEREKQFKLVFPVRVRNPQVTSEIPYGAIERQGNAEEYPCQQWVDVSGRNLDNEQVTYGVAIINREKYSCAVSGTEIQLTVLRSSIYADHGLQVPPDQRVLYQCMDQGLQNFAYRIFPHRGSWQEAGVVQAAQEFNLPTQPIWESGHAGDLPLQQSFLEVTPFSVVATVLKQAEDGSGDYVLRAYETAGRGAKAVFNAHFLGRTWNAEFGPSQIKTFRIPADARKPVAEVDFLEGAEIPDKKQETKTVGISAKRKR